MLYNSSDSGGALYLGSGLLTSINKILADCQKDQAYLAQLTFTRGGLTIETGQLKLTD